MVGSATEARSVEFFVRVHLSLRVVALREHSCLLVGTELAVLAIAIIDVASEHRTVTSAVYWGTVVDVTGSIFVLDFTVVSSPVSD